MTPFREPPSALDRATFLTRFGGVYEHNPWIAAATFDAGSLPATVEELADVMRAVVEAAPRDAQRILLKAHPDLAGRLVSEGGLTADCRTGRTSAGIDRWTPEELTAFQRLDTAYRARFGFPFIIAVRDLNRREILERFAERLGNSPGTEFRTALDEVHRIAGMRLMALAG